MTQKELLELRASIKGRPGSKATFDHWVVWIQGEAPLRYGDVAPKLTRILVNRAIRLEILEGLVTPATSEGRLPGVSPMPLGSDGIRLLLRTRSGEAPEGLPSTTWALHYDAGPGGGCCAATAVKHMREWARHGLGKDGDDPVKFASLRVKLLPGRILEMNPEWRLKYAAPVTVGFPEDGMGLGIALNSPETRANEIIRAGQRGGAA